MQHFHFGHGSGANWRDALHQAMATIPATESQLGILYATTAVAPHLCEIVSRLRQNTKIPHWIGGCTACVYAADQEYYDEPAVALLVPNLRRDQFRVVRCETRSTAELEDAAEGFTSAGRRAVVVIHMSPSSAATVSTLALLNRSHSRLHAIGGLLPTERTQLQLANQIGDSGVSGVVLHPHLRSISGVTQACEPIGPTHRLTKTDNNVAVSIDARPAMDVLLEDAGEFVARDPKRIAGFIYAGLPTNRPDEQYLVRSLVNLQPTRGAFTVGASLRQGQAIRFCRKDGNRARADLVRTVRRLRRQCPGRPLVGLYFASAARGRALFGNEQRESRVIHDLLGNIPIVGCQVNGELAGGELHGFSGVLTLLY